jgi:diguanylate cyclase (GGDEF)-like protein
MFEVSPEALFEVKLIFVRELEAGYAGARAAQEQLFRGPSTKEPLQKLRTFFHKIAGTAMAVNFAELGYSASMAERLCDLCVAGELRPEKLLPFMSDALAVVGTVLSGHSGQERPLAPKGPPVSAMGLVQPDPNRDESMLAKVLVIDDDVFSASLIDNCLRSAGFMSSYVSDPSQALTVIHSELPDLIIMDVVMPGIDGFDLCRRVRAHPALALTPVIFVTRKGDVEQRVLGLEVGGNDYISKPFEPQELVARVRSHLSRLATLRDMAIRDSLTRCYNHKYFKVRLEQELARAKRYKSDVALALLDIDHFKTVNDSHGHPAGDAVLATIADLVSAGVRSTDVVSRYGGEEFGILLVHAGAAEAQIITNRIRERVQKHAFEVHQLGQADSHQLAVTVSIGVAQMKAEDTPQSLLERTDAALYEAKHGGRNLVKVAG